MEASATATESLPKFSRYRTVRQRAATLQTLSSQSDTDPPPPPLPEASTCASEEAATPVKRAPSRYRRNNNVVAALVSPPLRAGPLPKLKDEHATAPTAAQTATSPSRYHRLNQGGITAPRDPPQAVTFNQHAVHREARQPVERKLAEKSGSLPRQPFVMAPEERYDMAREEARMILEGEYDRLQKMKRQAEKHRQVIGSRTDCAAPDLSRRRTSKHKDVNATTTATTTQPSSPVAAGEESIARSEQREPASEAPTTPKQIFRKIIAHTSPRQNARPSPPKTLDRVDSIPGATAPSAELITSTFDAPVSAVNTGDRRVTVRYQTSEITLPVTPSTTAKDLLNSASIILSSPPDPRTATLLESFVTDDLSLERPIRRYERVRDILNSWDNDTQNHLVILPSENDQSPSVHGLDLKDVPATAGRDMTLQMYHSARPGRWDKRWVRLREDGQVSVSKHESGIDSTNICHLSDFDLYAPTQKMAKKLKTPKKTLFAVKSQQKSAMFLQGANTNFAHFFCSGAKEVADQWYAAVHGWRSWYLVNVMGEGRVPPSGTGETIGERNEDLKRPGTARSQDTMPYQLGSFKPLLDFSDLAVATQSGEDSDGTGQKSTEMRRSVDSTTFGGSGKTRSPKRTNTIHRDAPPTAFPSRFILDPIDDNNTSTQKGQSGSGFTGKGLIAAHNPDVASLDDSSLGFTGRGLLARSATQRSQGGRGTGRGVSGTHGQPLVDLTPSSEFADGSLLRKLEAWKVQNSEMDMKLDREKRVEGQAKSGEGY